MKVYATIVISDPEQELYLDDGLSDDEIDDAVQEFAANHASQDWIVDWHKEE